MKNTKIKVMWISILLLIILSSSIGAYADDDTSEGTIQIDTDNDASSFVLVFDSTELVEPSTNVVFYAIIEDVDNDSTELTVVLYYSNDSFVSVNVSQSMSYVSSPETNQYRYEYTFTGQPAGVYYQYYYQVEDGYSRVKEDNSGAYYDIQWDTVGPYTAPAHISEKPKEVPYVPPTEPAKDDDMMLILIVIIIVAFIIVVAVIIASNKYNQLNRRWTDK